MSLDTRGVQIPNGSKNPDDEQNLLPAYVKKPCMEIHHLTVNSPIRRRVYNRKGRRSLKLQNARLWVGNRNIETGIMRQKPRMHITIGLNEPKPRLTQPEEDAIHEQTPAMRARQSIVSPPNHE